MITIICKDGEFLAKGTWNFGIAGIFENKEYGEGNINIAFSFDELCECLDKAYTYEELAAFMSGAERNGEGYDRVLTDFYNKIEQKMIDNQKLINNHILINVFEGMNMCGNEFWENKDTLTEEYKEKELSYEDVYTDEADKAITELYDAYYETPNDGSVEKPDAEKILREKSSVCFQSSDGWDESIMCGAYDEFDEKLMGRDWHNF